MKKLHFVLVFLYIVHGKLHNDAKKEFCDNLKCDETENAQVCGIRYEENRIRLRLFNNECQLLKFGCQVDDNQTFGLISIEYCISTENESIKLVQVKKCPDCSEFHRDPVCGIRPDGEGFRVRKFENKCELEKYNCEIKQNFTITDYFICFDNAERNNIEEKLHNLFEKYEDSANKTNIKDKFSTTIENTKNLVVLHGPMSLGENINKSVADFFASTHTYGIPISVNESTRRRIITNLGPVKVFTPQFFKPKKIKDDWWHIPTLKNCYHRCPTKCPDSYVPICAIAGANGREPAVVFQNHCFMDAAQCKLYWSDPEYGSYSSGYTETGFIFCLGTHANQAVFLPLVRTLQYMGRIKKSDYFRKHIRNMKHLSMPNIMG